MTETNSRKTAFDSLDYAATADSTATASNLFEQPCVRLKTVCEDCVLLSVAVVVIVAHVVAIARHCTPQRLRNHAKTSLHEIGHRNGCGILRNKRCPKFY